MKKTSSGFSKFITYSFLFHIVAAVFLIIYAKDYEQQKNKLEEIQKEEDKAKSEEELKADIEEILSEIVEEPDEKKKEKIIDELKDKIWEELKEEKEDLLVDKKELEKEKYLEELAEKTKEAIEELKKKEDEAEKKKELIEELVAKDLPEIEKKIEEEVKNKTVEELESEALKDSLAELKKITEEELKPVLEKDKEGYLKKIEELLKQLADTAKKDDTKSLHEEIKNILDKTDEIVGKAEEITKKFEEASKEFKKEQLDVALEVFKDKEKAVDEKKAEIAEAFQKTTENEKSKANFTKLPETEKEWDKAISQNKEQPIKPEDKNILSKPLEELAKLDTEKDKAEKVLKEIIKEELTEVKKATEEVKQIVTTESASKKVAEIQKELDEAAAKSQSKYSNEFKKSAETIQSVKTALPEIAKNTSKNAAEVSPKDPLDNALQNLKSKEEAIEKKKEEVTSEINKASTAEKTTNTEASAVAKAPASEKDWQKLIEQSNEKAKSSENKKMETPLEKSVADLAKLSAEKSKAEDELKKVAKETIAESKKASNELEKTAKTNENKKQVSDVKNDIAKSEKQTDSADSKNLKEGAETLQNIKKTLPEIANAIKNSSDAVSKDPLDKALSNFKAKEEAIEKKKEEVTSEINKASTAEKAANAEAPAVAKAPASEKDWQKLIEQSNEKAKSSENKKAETPLEKSVSDLAKLDAEKSKAGDELKKVAKETIAETKKASNALEKTAQTNENKKQVSDVKKDIAKSEKQTDSAESKNLKEGAETLQNVKKALPEIANAIKNSSETSSKDPAELKTELEVAKNLIEKSIKDLTELKTGVEPEDKPVTEKLEARIAKANDLLKNVQAEKTEKNENKFTDEQIKEPKENLEKAQKIVNDIKNEIAKDEQNIKKESDTLKNNLSEKEKTENKEAVAGLESAVKSLAQTKALEPKLEALDQAESKLDDIKSNINEQRKETLAKSQEQLQKVKNLANEISEGLKNPSDKKSKESVVAEIENQAMANAMEEKAKTFDDFLAENESEDQEKQSKEFKEEAKDNIEAAINNKLESKVDKESSESSELEVASEEESAESEKSEGSEEDGENSKSKAKGKGEKGNGKGKSGEENSALAKALADKVEGQGKKGEGKGKEEGKSSDDDNGEKEKGKTPGKGSGQRLDGNSKSSSEIAHNIIIRNTKVFNKSIVTAEDEKRIFTENINYEAIRIPPVIKFAKPTANGLPLEIREPSMEVFMGAEATKTKVIEKPKNPERDRIKNEKFTKGNFAAIPYLKNKPLIDGKRDDWQLDKSWVKNDKRIAMGWRSDGLYFFASIRDRTDKFESASTGEMFSTWWRFDCVELWIDMQNSKSDDTNKFDCQQFTFWPALANIRPAAELYEVLWGKRAKNSAFKERKIQVKSESQNVVASVEHPDHRGYDIEVYIPSENLLNKDFFKGGQVAGFLYIINHGNLVEDSSLEFYKEGYDGYSSHPSSWGNIQLLGTDAKIEQIDFNKKVIKEKVVEVSTNLSLQVTDQDSNQDPNVIDKVTVRVKNENSFDGIKSEDTDWEDIKFTETGKNTGVFTGTITLTVAPSKPDDNALCAHAGDILHAYYNDHIQVAGEYDEKMHLTIKVVAPVIKVAGRTNTIKTK